MGFFDFFRRKKKDTQAEQKLEPVKENRTDRPFEKRQTERRKEASAGSDAKHGVNQTTPRHNTHGSQQRRRNQRPARKHYSTHPNREGKAERSYTVKAGDSLSRIAKDFYGNANDWQKIYQANKNRIKDPNIIHPGQTLIIP